VGPTTTLRPKRGDDDWTTTLLSGRTTYYLVCSHTPGGVANDVPRTIDARERG
jgi:hypothetical protein